MATKTIRVVSREVDGSLRVKDHGSLETLKTCYDQVGIDDCSTDLTLRGFPLFRGLVGPMAEGKRIARYETPEVFEALTKEWAAQRVRRRNRSEIMAAEAAETAEAAGVTEATSASDATTVHPQQRPAQKMHFPVISLPKFPAATEFVS